MEQARLRLEEALAANPDDVRLLVLKARADARTSRFSEAAGYFQRAAALQREEGDRAGEAASLLEAADALTRDGYGAEARVTYNRAIGCFELLGDEGSVARSRMALARHHLGRREHHEARPLLERCLRVLAAAGQHDELGWVRERLADIASAAKQPQQALEHARLAVEAAAKAKDRVAFGARLALVAALHRQAGNAAKARSYLEKALPHLRAAEDRLPLLDALVTLAELDPAQAPSLLAEALPLADRHGDAGQRGIVRVRLAEYRRPPETRELLEEALGLLRAAGDPKSAGPAWLGMARVLARAGDQPGTLEALVKARTFFEMVGDEERVAEVAALEDAAADGRWQP